MRPALPVTSFSQGRRILLTLFMAAVLGLGSLAVAPRAEAIVGGQNATQEYSHMAAFLSDGQWICGASLIAPEWILSAAHCVDDLDPSNYSFILGRDHLDDDGGEVIGAAEVIVHPEYTDTYDISLFRLERPSIYEPIALADPVEDRDLWEPGDTSRVIGYGGQVFPGLLADGQLREVDVPVVDDADCDFSYGPTFGGIDENTEVCAGELHGTKDSCQGDSGGPLMVRNEQEAFVQMGVVSWGFGCGFPTQYGVYARVGDHTLYDWIQETISKDPVDPVDPVDPPPPTEAEVVAVEPQGSIAGGTPLPLQEGVTATELELSCTTDLATQGVDGYAWELPEDLAVPGAVAKVTGDPLILHDLDLGFYGVVDGTCSRLGWAGTGDQDESAPVPAGTQFVLAHAWLGQDTFVDLTVEVPVVSSITETVLELADHNLAEARFGDEVTFEATLTDDDGAPLPEQADRFAILNENVNTLHVRPRSATDDDGVSSATMRLGVPAGEYSLEAVFIGRPDELQESKAEAPFTVDVAESAVAVEAAGAGNKREATVTLTEAESGVPIAARSVAVFADCELVGTADTDEDGTATFALSGRHRAPTVTLSALFAGDEGDERYYGAASEGPDC